MPKICTQCGTRYGEESTTCTDDGHGLTPIEQGLPFSEGMIAGRFPVVRTIGAGAMGTVYLAVHPSLRARLAIKLIKPDLIGDRDAIARFKREAVNAFRIDNANVVRVYDLIETGPDELALVMEFVDGVSLAELIPDIALGIEQRNVSRVCRLSWQIAAGLDAAHAVGVAHRDLKPANVMIARTPDSIEVAKIVDFGLAKSSKVPEAPISQAGELLGTPEYFSPEQASFSQSDSSSDRYALGLIAFEMLTGTLPFARGPLAQVITQRASTAPQTLTQACPGIEWSPTVQRVFDRGFASDPTARYDSAGQFARELNEALTYQRPAPAQRARTSGALFEPGAVTNVAPEVVTIPRKKGKVKSYSLDKQWGIIRTEGGVEHRAWQADILGPGLKVLVAGENVEFDAGVEGTAAEAKRVKRLDPRRCGTVADFDFDLGYGRIIPDGESRRIFVHYSSVIIGDRGGVAALEDGERVEFELINTPRGENASRVLRLDPRSPLTRFADLGDIDAQLQELAENLAQKENWNYREQPAKDRFPILRSYIYFTFSRLLDEGKIAEQQDGRGRRIACFNTALVTDLQEEIFAYFDAAPSPRTRTPSHEFAPPAPWVFRGFVKRDDRRLSHFGTPPTIANYFTSPSDLLYDLSVELVVDWEHILARKKRFPRSMKAMEDTMLKRQISQTIEDAKSRVRRNYKTAIPQFHRGHLQLLLPLCLEKPDRADLALVVMRDHRVYRAFTVLPLDWAIRNARLIARPDREWLDP